MFLWGGFEIPTSKTLEKLENIQKNVFNAVLIPDWKSLCRHLFGSAQKRKDILRFQSFPEAFANVYLFLLLHRLTKQNSLLQQNQATTKVFPVSFVRKQSKWRHFIKVTGLLLTFSKRNTSYKISRSLIWIEFAVQSAIFNYCENWLHWKYFLWVFQFFKIAGRASLEESLFSKVIGEISTSYNSVKNPFTCTGVFRKVVLLKIPKNLQFTPNNFLKCLDCSLMQFFLSELHAKNCRLRICALHLAHFWIWEKLLG